jgi:hypothetical protein
MYRKLGLNLTLADKSVEAGIQQVWELLSAGKLKVFTSCGPFFDEYRLYRRDDKGRVVKKDDHLMDCLRMWVRSGLTRATVQRATGSGPTPTVDAATAAVSWMNG